VIGHVVPLERVNLDSALALPPELSPTTEERNPPAPPPPLRLPPPPPPPATTTYSTSPDPALTTKDPDEVNV
jgi:hypothetical protein